MFLYASGDKSILAIQINSSEFQTARGTRVGDTLAQVRKVYGPPTYRFAGNLQYDLSRASAFDRYQISFVKAHQKVEQTWLFYPVQ